MALVEREPEDLVLAQELDDVPREVAGLVDLSWMYTLRTAADASAMAGARAGAVAVAANATSAATTAAQKRWSSIGLPGTPTFTVVRTGTPQVQRVNVQLHADALIGLLVSSSDISATASQAVAPRVP